ncbi:MAG: hypothetical protein WBM04_09760 [Candidatus Korobacteraceae bacterium]
MPRWLTNSMNTLHAEHRFRRMAKKHPSTQNVKKGKERGPLKRSFAILGPGLITAADDDPLGISTDTLAATLSCLLGPDLMLTLDRT